MVLQRRLEYGFNGYRVPEVPRASRSARGRGPIRSKFEANQIHAFESLASVAGKLLQESKTLCQLMILVERIRISNLTLLLKANNRIQETC